MRKLPTAALLLATTGCYYAPFNPSAALPVEEIALQAEVSETESGRFEVTAHLALCGSSFDWLDLSGGDYLTATLDGETVELHSDDHGCPDGVSHAVFPRRARGGRVTVTLQRGSLVEPGFDASVVPPARVRITSPRRYRAVDVGSDTLEVRWKRKWGRNPGSLGADLVRWRVDPLRERGDEFVPSSVGDLQLDRADVGFDLPSGTLSGPVLSGRRAAKNLLRVTRLNQGLVDGSFCPESSIWAYRESERVFRSRP